MVIYDNKCDLYSISVNITSINIQSRVQSQIKEQSEIVVQNFFLKVSTILGRASSTNYQSLWTNLAAYLRHRNISIFQTVVHVRTMTIHV